MLGITKHIFLSKIRNKELLMQILLTSSCVVFALFIPVIAKIEYSFSSVFELIYEQSTAMISLALAFIVSPSIIDGIKRKEINWYVMHNIRAKSYLLGNFIYFVITVLIVLIILIITLSISISFFFGKNAPTILTLSLIFPVTIYSISMYIFISTIAKNKAIAVISSVVVCFGLMILNLLLPVVNGYIAPYDINSIQYNAFLEVLHNTSKLNFDFLLAVILPLLYSVILILISSLVLEKRINESM